MTRLSIGAAAALFALQGCESQDVVVFATGTGGTSGTGGALVVESGGFPPGAPEAAPMDAGSNALPCHGDGQGTCPRSLVCSKRSCSDQEGVCVERPVFCETTFRPVCGCDQYMYWNDCLRLQGGASASTPGGCPPSSGRPRCNPTSNDCRNGAFCANLLPPMVGCGPPVSPVCTVIPDNCDSADDSMKWFECVPPGAPQNSGQSCVSTCDAIRSGRLFAPLPPRSGCHP